MEAPRGAREPTGTNGPTLNTHINHKRLTDIQGCSSPLYGSQPTQTPHATQAAGNKRGHFKRIWLNHLVVVIAAGKRPASIPNLEAKPASADGTAPGRVWESRTPPQHSIQRVGPGTQPFQAPPLYVYPAIDAHTTRKHSIQVEPLVCAANC